MDALQPQLDEFVADLARLDSLLALLSAVRELAVAAPTITASDPFHDAAVALRDQVRAAGADLPVLGGTLLLYLTGRFEFFAKSQLETLCEALADKCQTFDQLPETLRTSLVSMTADHISRPSRYGLDPIQVRGLVTTLATNIQSGSGVGIINAACLSVTDRNMTSEMLADLFKRADVKYLWRELAKQARIKVFYGHAVDADVERAAKAELDSLMNLRNSIAHPSTATSFPDLTNVRRAVTFLVYLAETITDVCRIEIAAFHPAVKSQP